MDTLLYTFNTSRRHHSSLSSNTIYSYSSPSNGIFSNSNKLLIKVFIHNSELITERICYIIIIGLARCKANISKQFQESIESFR